MREWNILFRCVCLLMVVVAASGCYVQQPLPRDPTDRPASWEPIMGLRTRTGQQIDFDEPATIEAGRVVYRVDGRRTSLALDQVDRLYVGQKVLDKPKTIIFAAVFLTAFAFFFASIKFN